MSIENAIKESIEKQVAEKLASSLGPLQYTTHPDALRKIDILEQDLTYARERLNVQDNRLAKQDSMIRELTTLNIKDHQALYDKIDKDIAALDKRISVLFSTLGDTNTRVANNAIDNRQEHNRFNDVTRNLEERANHQAKAGITQTARLELINARVNTLMLKLDPVTTVYLNDAYPGSTVKAAGMAAGTTDAEPVEVQANANKMHGFDASKFADKACETQISKRIPISTLKAISELADKLEAMVRSL